MHRIFTSLVNWLNALVAVPRLPDALDQMTPAELADLPVTHPAADPEPC